jgi:hypothetical protein
VSWLNPWSWNPDAVDRWGLRIAGFGRWIMVLISVGAAVGFLAWFGVTATEDFQLSRHGVVVTAAVEDTAPYGRDTQYLLSFVIDGRPDAQWTTGIAELKVGDTVSVIVDRGDHAHLLSTAAYGRRWAGYVVQVFMSAAFALLGIMFVRMDAAGFRRYTRARYGHI